MEKESVKQLLSKISDLQIEIDSWGVSNRQSNPGAVMHLRWMKKEVEKLTLQLNQYRSKKQR
jgi:hypothetical protein